MMETQGSEMVDFVCSTESLVYLGFLSNVTAEMLYESIFNLGFGRTSQIRTRDLYHVNIDGCTNVHISARIFTE